MLAQAERLRPVEPMPGGGDVSARRRVVNVGDVFGRLTITKKIDTGTVAVRCSCGADETRETRSLLYPRGVPMCDACKYEISRARAKRNARRFYVAEAEPVAEAVAPIVVLTPAQVIAESGAPSLAPGRGERRDCVRWESCLDAYLALFPRFGESEAHCPSDCGAFVPESSLRRARVDAIASARAPREVAW
jgi:hypothetical protein